MEAGLGLSKLPEDDNSTIQQLCREEEVGFVGRADMFMRDGLRLNGRCACSVCG